MSTFIEYGLDRVYREIPLELLSLAFNVTNWEYTTNRTSMEANIRGKVIESMVLPDLNLVCSNVAEIPLYGLQWEYVNGGIRIHVPKSLTNGRNIISVLSIEQISRGVEGYQWTEGRPSSTGLADVYLVAPNTVFVTSNVTGIHTYLRCNLENEDNLGNLAPRAKIDFGALCVLATKSQIYTKLAINISIDSMTGGRVDGNIRSLIDEYADANEMYIELLNIKMRKISFMSDRKQHNRIIQLGLGG